MSNVAYIRRHSLNIPINIVPSGMHMLPRCALVPHRTDHKDHADQRNVSYSTRQCDHSWLSPREKGG